MSKTAQAFRTISEVSDELDVPKHVLRFWELKFPQIKPMKRGGGRRYYRPEDIQLLSGIRHLLHAEAYTIKGVQKILRERGVEAVKAAPAGGGRTASAEKSSPQLGVKSPAAGPKTGRRRTAADAKAAAPAKSRADVPALPPGAARAVEQAIAELRACREMLRTTAPLPASAAGRSKAQAVRQARRQA